MKKIQTHLQSSKTEGNYTSTKLGICMFYALTKKTENSCIKLYL